MTKYTKSILAGVFPADAHDGNIFRDASIVNNFTYR